MIAVTPTPKGKKAGWYINFYTSPYKSEVHVYRTKALALHAARRAKAYGGLVTVDWLWGRLSLKEEIGILSPITDHRKA